MRTGIQVLPSLDTSFVYDIENALVIFGSKRIQAGPTSTRRQTMRSRISAFGSKNTGSSAAARMKERRSISVRDLTTRSDRCKMSFHELPMRCFSCASLDLKHSRSIVFLLLRPPLSIGTRRISRVMSFSISPQNAKTRNL